MEPLALNELRDVWRDAQGFSWNNTARGVGPGGTILETRMRDRCFSAGWTSGDFGRFNYPSHMRNVGIGNVIFMYASKCGVIGVGVASGTVDIIPPSAPDRLRRFEDEGHNQEEHRIPVRWVLWHEDNPCVVFPPIDPREYNATFRDISGEDGLLRHLWRHYFGSEPYPLP